MEQRVDERQGGTMRFLLRPAERKITNIKRGNHAPGLYPHSQMPCSQKLAKKRLTSCEKNWSWKENLNLKSFDQGRHLLQKVGSKNFRKLPIGRLCFTFIFPPLHWTLIERGGMVFDLLALAGYPALLAAPIQASAAGPHQQEASLTNFDQ